MSMRGEADKLRVEAAMIRKHVARLAGVMGLASTLSWIGVAEAEEQLADALELEPVQAVAS